MIDEPQPPPPAPAPAQPTPPTAPWWEKPRGRLAPEEVDALDRRLGRVRRRPTFFL